jgi:hypothetical protein
MQDQKQSHIETQKEGHHKAHKEGGEMSKVIEKNGVLIGIMSTLIISVITFAFTFGTVRNQLDADQKGINNLQSQRADETRVLVDQHERRLTNLEGKQDKFSQDLSDVKSDVKVIRQVVESQNQAPPQKGHP